MTTTTDSLTRAVSYLGAVEVAPGRYAWELNPASDQRTWLTATADELCSCEWVTLLGEVHLEWPEGNNRAVIMPSWWTPKKKFAVVKPDGSRLACLFDPNELITPLHTNRDRSTVVTADLETGKEIPA